MTPASMNVPAVVSVRMLVLAGSVGVGWSCLTAAAMSRGGSGWGRGGSALAVASQAVSGVTRPGSP